jgi:hypothetical protein
MVESAGHDGRGLRHAAPLGAGTLAARMGPAHQRSDRRAPSDALSSPPGRSAHGLPARKKPSSVLSSTAPPMLRRDAQSRPLAPLLPGDGRPTEEPVRFDRKGRLNVKTCRSIGAVVLQYWHPHVPGAASHCTQFPLFETFMHSPTLHGQTLLSFTLSNCVPVTR